MMLLKQSTAVTVMLGPFLDATDAVTAETALTISQADVRLSKNGGAFAQKNDANAAAHGENGYYTCQIDATDTGTLGRLRLAVSESGALPVWHEFMVVPANVYDSLVAGSDTLQSDVTQIGGVAQSATDLKDFADAGYDPDTNKVQGVVLVDTTTTNTDMRGTEGAYTGTPPTADAIGTDAASKILVTPAQKLATDASGRVTVGTNADKTGYALSVAPPTAAQNADAVWDEAQADHVAAGSTGESLNNAGGGSSPADIADAVWDEAIEDHETTGSTGKALSDANLAAGSTPEQLWSYAGAQGRTLTRAVGADQIAPAGKSVAFEASNSHDQEAGTLIVDQHAIQNVIMTFYLDGVGRTVTGYTVSFGGYTQAGQQLFLKSNSDMDKTLAYNKIGVTLAATDLAEANKFAAFEVKLTDGSDVNERYKGVLEINKSNLP